MKTNKQMSVIAAAISGLLLASAVSFAAPVAMKRVKPMPRTEGRTSEMGKAPEARTNTMGQTKPVGGSNILGKGVADSILTQTSQSIVAEKLGASCGKDSAAAILNSVEIAALAQAKTRGLAGSSCLEKFAGADNQIVLRRAQRMIAAGNKKFDQLMPSDRNNDGKVDVADLTNDEAGSIFIEESNILGNEVQIDRSESLDRLFATVDNNCDLVSPTLASKAKGSNVITKEL
jgi:hypothetical protein